MGVRTEYQAVITCDSCGDNWVEAYYTQKMALRNSRKQGWKIGKKVTCPMCQKKLAPKKE